MSYGCGNDKTTPIDTHVISNAHPFVKKFLPNVSLVGCLIAFNSQNNFQWVWLREDHTHIWLIMLSLVLGDHTQIFGLIGL